MQTQIDYYYNPPIAAPEIPKELINYIDYYIEARRHELKPVMVDRCNVIKSKLIKFDPIKYQNPNYSIYTIDGKNILDGTFFSNIESKIESISITSLNKGTYIFVLEENGHKETKKFIIN